MAYRKSCRCVLGLIAAGFSCGAAVHAQPRPHFDFNTYEYSSIDQDAYGQVPSAIMSARAQAFIDARYPAGSSAQAAVKDFRRAGAACRPDLAMSRHVVCSYVLPSHGMTALVGSAVWRIDIYSDAADAVASITVSRRLAAD
jgi:hypothetical protein